ncbi:hypothetical protein H2203_000952 [Taxawa tesnikishii (nom. ined.)]|nr:hypothetical protein H2203_000952 [Dothideales sp. JES 119]
MRVLISGAGIAGPTLAWFLSKAGARITLVEKCQSVLRQGQNIDIKGSAVTAIRTMGLLDRIREFHTTEKGTQFIDARGRPFAVFPGSTVSLTSEFEILRGDLAAVLYEATKDLPNVNYLFGTTVKEVISNETDAVKVELSNGDVQDDNDWWNIYHALGSKIITLRPDPHGTIRAMFTRMPCNDIQKKAWQRASRSGRQMQEELLRSEFADAGWQAQRLLNAMGHTSDFYFQAIQQIKMTRWFANRVVCLGDAACAPTPLTGMGTSLAITGAYVLAGELSKLDDGENPRRALEAYETTFRPFVEKAQEIPSFVPEIAHPESAWKRWLFQVGVSTFSKAVATPWLANKFERSTESRDEGFPLPFYPILDINRGPTKQKRSARKTDGVNSHIWVEEAYYYSISYTSVRLYAAALATVDDLAAGFQVLCTIQLERTMRAELRHRSIFPS